jgi:RNA polymerase sigma-70 factor (ECF subfamily)
MTEEIPTPDRHGSARADSPAAIGSAGRSVPIHDPADAVANAPGHSPERATPTPKRGRAPPPEDTRRVPPEIKRELVDNMKVLRAFAISLTRNGSRADDLVQETVMKAWANIHSYKPGTNMRAWLFTILRNTFYSERRKAKREVADEDGEMAAQIARKPDHDGRLQYQDFRRAFEQLPDEQREVLILVGAMQYSYEEAAEMCGVRMGTIKSRLNRGRARLAELMEIDEAEALELTDNATAAVVTSNGNSTL